MNRLLFAVTVVAVLCAGSTWSDDKKNDKDAEVEKALSKIAQLGKGVHAIKIDKKGRITSCVVVGQATITTVLGKERGIQIARDKARLNASAEFVKWLKEKASVYEKSEEEIIIFVEGSDENDKGALKESGKSVEKTSKKMESIAEGLVRGLQVLHVEISGKDKTYTLIMGWSAENAKAIKQIEKGRTDKNNEAKKPTDKKVEDKKVTSEDAKKFLP